MIYHLGTPENWVKITQLLGMPFCYRNQQFLWPLFLASARILSLAFSQSVPLWPSNKGVNNILCIGDNLQIIIKIITLCWAGVDERARERRKGQIMSVCCCTSQLVKLFYANYFQFYTFWCFSYKQHVCVRVFLFVNIFCNNSIRDYRVRADKLPIRFNAASIRWNTLLLPRLEKNSTSQK